MANQNYNRTIPDAPLPVSMLPRAEALTLNDLLLLVQPGNTQGHRTKALTLQLLAQFLQTANFDEILLRGENGRTLTLTGNGTTFSKPHVSQSDQRDYSITEDDTGITLSITSPSETRTIVLGYTSMEISSTANGLTQKITLSTSGITYSNQTRVDAQVVTTTREISKDAVETEELKFFSSMFPKQSWSFGIAESGANLKELVLSFTGSETAQRFVIDPKVLFKAQAQFEKDVTINADLFVTGTKTLNVAGKSNLHNTSIDGYLGIKELLLSGAVGGGAGCWVCSAHPDNDFYNQAASTGHLWFVVNDTDSTQNVGYHYSGGAGGQGNASTVTMPSHSITAFLRMGSEWYHWA